MSHALQRVPSILIVASMTWALSGCETVRPWERGTLARPEMQLDPVAIRQFRLVTPVGRAWSVGLDVSRETMSGASPWATVPGADGEPALIMSGATIHDSRTETSLTATRYGDDHSIGLTLTRSEENDYEALSPAFSGEWAFNDALTTLSAGLSWSSAAEAPIARASGR